MGVKELTKWAGFHLIKRTILILAILGAVAAPCFATTWYVQTNGDDTANTGSSWTNAKKTVGKAITLSISGDSIYVAAGTYNERITLQPGVKIYGGFSGVASNPLQRDLKAYASILDGGHSGTVVTFPSGVTSSTGIDGFVISKWQGSSWRRNIVRQ